MRLTNEATRGTSKKTLNGDAGISVLLFSNLNNQDQESLPTYTSSMGIKS